MSNSTTSAIDSASSSSSSTSSSSSSAAAASSSAAASVSSSVLSSLSSSASADTLSATSQISTSTASSLPPSTVFFTSVITRSGSASGQSSQSQTVIVTFTSSRPASVPTNPSTTSSSSSAAATTSDGAALQPGQKQSSGGGLTGGAKTAIAVVIPVVVVAALVVAGLYFWRKRKHRKNEEEQRRKEMEDYGYNPNNDPTLPAVGAASGSEMTEDQSGYRGWGGTTATASNRKASTTLSGGVTGAAVSDTTSQPGGYHSPGSPSMGTTDGHSGEPLMNNRRETFESDGVGALGGAPAAGAGRDIRRGPSNASSSYSAGDRSHHSADAPIPANEGYGDQYGADNQYYQAGPYDSAAYGGVQPIVREVQARRNTRIEEPRVRPGQGNSGIAQNF